MGQPEEFLVNVRYGVYLTRRESEADISLTSGPTDSDPAHVVEVPRDSVATHPYRRMELIAKIQEFCPSANSYDVQCINDVFGAKRRSEWFYQNRIPGSPGQYSQRFLDWIRTRYEQDSEFFNTDSRQKEESESTLILAMRA